VARVRGFGKLQAAAVAFAAVSESRLLTPRFALIVTAGFAYFGALGMVLPTLPLYVERALDAGNVAVGVVVGSFAVGAIALRPAVGRVGDRLGRRPLLITGAVVVAVSILGQIWIDAIPGLVGLRLLGGLGEAAFFVGAATMITDMAPPARRGEAISFWSVAVYGGLGLGPPLGVWIEEHHSFDTVWTVAGALALGAFVLALFTRETRDPDLAVVTGPQPLINRNALIPGLFLAVCLAPLIGFTAFGALYMEEIGLRNAGLVYFVYGISVLVVRIVGAKVPDRLGPRIGGTVAAIGGGISGLVFALIANPVGVFIGAAILALGLSQLYPAATLLSLTDAPAGESASIIGTVCAFFDLASSVGPVLFGLMVTATSYRLAFALTGVIAILSLFVLRSDPRTATQRWFRGAPDVEFTEPPLGT